MLFETFEGPRSASRTSAPACGEAATKLPLSCPRGPGQTRYLMFWRSGRPARPWLRPASRPPSAHEATYTEPRRATPVTTRTSVQAKGEVRHSARSQVARLLFAAPHPQLSFRPPQHRYTRKTLLSASPQRITDHITNVSESPSQAHCASKCQTAYFGLDTHLRSGMYQTRTRRGRARDESS